MKRLALLLVVAAALFGVYQAVLALVRAHVDGEIEKNVGATLPAFSLEDTAGRTWSSDALAGKVVVLNFMRSACSSCEKEKPAVRAFASELDPDEVVLLSVMTDRVEGYDPATTERTLARAAFEHPFLMADAAFVDAFHGAGWAHVTPVTYFVRRDGEIAASLRGAQSLESLRAGLARAR
ncbi:MAG: TlpA family protein disulfide reductase [Planctomycetota bacterium JB042]